MKTETLKLETAAKVQELASINVDSSEGFLSAAKVVQNPRLSTLFRELALERARFATELKLSLGARATKDTATGSLTAKAHRWWLELRGKLSGGDDYAILSEAERGEDQIKAAYEEVIKETAGSPVSDTLHSQLASIKSAHDQILGLREIAKA